MNPRVLVHSLTIDGPSEEKAYPFGSGVNLIVGGVGTGKTSLLQMLKWTLGGTAIQSAAVRDGVLAATLDLELNDRRFLLRRERDARELEVVDYQVGSVVARPAVAGRQSHEHATASDFLLGELGIPRLELPRARQRSTRHRTTISFWDVLDYVYVTQTEMDGSIVHHDDPIRDPKRRATFELIYGLVDEEVARLERRIGDLNSQLSETRRLVAGIRSFLASGDEPSEASLRLEEERLEADIRQGRTRVENLRLAGREATGDGDRLRREVLGHEDQLRELRRREQELTVEVARYRAVIAQLELELDRLARGEVATEILGPYEFRQCPRCLQSIVNRDLGPHVCQLCLQDEPPQPDPAAIAAEERRLAAQQEETRSLLAESENEWIETSSLVARAQAELADLHESLNARTATFVSERFDEIESATRALTEAITRRQAVERALELHDRLRAQSAEIPLMEAQIRDARSQLGEERARLDAARAKVGALSLIFDELLQQIGYPWYPEGGTWIDAQSYLPVVGPDSFDQASAGMRTLLNVAYHLAGLRYGLQQQDSLLPLFLMLDSPRKNLGHLADRRIGERMYRRFRALHDAFGGQFQMILADNDPPAVTAEFPTIALTYDQPFVPWVVHPGPTEVVPIER